MQKKILAVAGLSCLALAAGGCGQNANSPGFSGGSADENYRGIVPAVLTQKFKITQEELTNGIKKEPLRAVNGQILIPESSIENNANKARKGMEDALKPNI